MGFLKGSQIRPELGRADFSPIERGGAAMGNAWASIGQNVGAGLKEGLAQNKMYGDAIKAAEPWIKALETMRPEKPGDTPSRDDLLDPNMGAKRDQYDIDNQSFSTLDKISEAIKNEELPKSVRAQMAQQFVTMAQGMYQSGFDAEKKKLQNEKLIAEIKNLDARTKTEGAGGARAPSPGQYQGMFKIPGEENPVPVSYNPNAQALTIMDNMGNETILPEGSVPYESVDTADTRSPLESPQIYVNTNTESEEYGNYKTFGMAQSGPNTGEVGYVKKGKFVPVSEDWEMSEEITARSYTPADYGKKRDELITLEEGLRKVDGLMEAREGAGMGIEYIKNRTTGLAKTLLGGRDKLTKAERDAELASKKFQSAIGQFRVETVGPGIVTEFDAHRIEQAIGGALMTGNWEVVQKLMGDIRAEKQRKADFMRKGLTAARNANPSFSGEQWDLMEPYVPPAQIQNFNSVAEAEAANLEPGTLITINGVQHTKD